MGLVINHPPILLIGRQFAFLKKKASAFSIWNGSTFLSFANGYGKLHRPLTPPTSSLPFTPPETSFYIPLAPTPATHFFWNSVLAVKEPLTNIRWNLGDGSIIGLSKDCWVSDNTLLSLHPFPSDLAFSPISLVSDHVRSSSTGDTLQILARRSISLKQRG